jgi:tRNA-dihydrouridine synthase
MTIRALAPMDWITWCAFRSISLDLFNQYNKDQTKQLRMFTEFMSSEWYLRNPQRLTKHLLTSSDQFWSNLVAQIYWGDAEHLLQTAIEIDQKYDFFTWIELNIWCPSPKVMSCEAWSWMLKDRTKTLEIIKSISSNIQKPFSIKTRAWLSIDDKLAQQDFIVQASEYCSMITIHGRTYKQSHSWEVDRDYIYNIKNSLYQNNSNVKIIWNWWLSTYHDGENYLHNLDGVMFGRNDESTSACLTSTNN